MRLSPLRQVIHAQVLQKIGTAMIILLCVADSPAQVKLNVTGATFPYPLYSKWFEQYHKEHPEVEINYQAKGSGAGIRQLIEGTVDFGASDGPMTDEQLRAVKEKRNIEILHIPTVLGAIVPAYNLPGVHGDVRFSGELLAAIYLGKVTRWSDPAIVNENPSVKLPDKPIIVVHRVDGSAATYIFTDYLSKVSPEWKATVGKGTSVAWPVGVHQQGCESVASTVTQMVGSITFLELTYALLNHISYGAVKNAAGNYIKADLESVAAAAGSVEEMPDDFRVSITNPPGATAYPIASFTWLLVPANWSNASKKKVMVDFLYWMIDSGQKMAPSAAYAPLPDNVATKVRAVIMEASGERANLRPK